MRSPKKTEWLTFQSRLEHYYSVLLSPQGIVFMIRRNDRLSAARTVVRNTNISYVLKLAIHDSVYHNIKCFFW